MKKALLTILVLIAFLFGSSTAQATVGVWQDQGIVITHSAGNSPFLPNVVYEGNAKILSGNVFKMWYTCLASNEGTCYAESSDGITWTQYSSNPVISGQGYTRTFEYGGTYYAYTSTLGGGLPAAVNVYTSTDGVAFTLQKTGTLTTGSGGSWDSTVLVQLTVLDNVAGTWYGYYAGSNSAGATTQSYPAGLATSTDLINWTKGGSNPVITGDIQTDFTWNKVGSTYYGWSQVRLADIPGTYAAFPSDLKRFTATNPSGPWTETSAPTIYRTTAAQGVGISIGQVADPSLVVANGNLYMFYSIDSSGILNSTEAIGLAIITGANVTQLVATTEGVQSVPIPDGLSAQLNTLASDNFTRSNANPIGGNWTNLIAAQTAQILSNKVTSSTAGTPGDSYYSGRTWANDQWSQVTLGTITNGSYAGAACRMSTSGAQTQYKIVLTGGTGSSASFVFQKFVTGTYTALASGTIGTVSAGDTLTCTAIGTQISAYWNQVLLYTITDSGISSGSAGFEMDAVTSTSNSAITAWAGGNFNQTTFPGAGTGTGQIGALVVGP
jgi:hypothetical protein